MPKIFYKIKPYNHLIYKTLYFLFKIDENKNPEKIPKVLPKIISIG